MNRILRSAPFAIYAVIVALCSVGLGLSVFGYWTAGGWIAGIGAALAVLLLIGIAIASAIIEWREP